MKKSIFAAVLGIGMASAISSYGQGFIIFNNYVSSTQSSGITFAAGSPGGIAGEGIPQGFTVTLLYGASTDTLISQLVPLNYSNGGNSSPAPVGTDGTGTATTPGPILVSPIDSGAGIFDGGSVQIPLTGLNSFAAGSTLAIALEANGTWNGVTYSGFSALASITTSASSTANVPDLPASLQSGSFTVAPVPEPTTLALAGLGGAALLALRRKKA
jgi:hypothetical protein